MNVEPVPSTLHTRHLAAVVGGDVLDDRQARARCRRWPASGPGRPGRTARRSGRSSRLGDADALVGDADLDQWPSPAPVPHDRDPACPRGCSATALSTRLPSAVTSCRSSPMHLQPGSPPATRVIPLASRGQPAAVDAPRPRRRRRRPGVGAAQRVVALQPGQVDERPGPARASRSDSCCIRPANRRTASGSSAASGSASASSDSAPTGVLSSWLTLATKSRRTASTRRASVRSSTSTSTSGRAERGDPGQRRCRVAGRTGRGGSSSSASRISPSRRTACDQVEQLVRPAAARRGPGRRRTRPGWPGPPGPSRVEDDGRGRAAARAPPRRPRRQRPAAAAATSSGC